MVGQGAGQGTAAGHSLRGSLRRLSATLLDIAHTRLALLAAEVEEEKRRLLAVMAWGALGVLMGSIGLVFLAAFVCVLFWDTHRLLVLGCVSGAFFSAGLVACWQVHARVNEQQGPLHDTLAELEADRKALNDPPIP